MIEGEDFTVEGVPADLEGARDLWERDKYHFQKWAVEQVDGFVTTKRSADGGIDGRIYFGLPNEPDLQRHGDRSQGRANGQHSSDLASACMACWRTVRRCWPV